MAYGPATSAGLAGVEIQGRFEGGALKALRCREATVGAAPPSLALGALARKGPLPYRSPPFPSPGTHVSDPRR